MWVEKYRPKTIEDCILPPDLKTTFQQFVDNNHIPNLLLSGPAGVGKTTVAKAMLEQLGCDYIVINGSMNGNIDTLRNDILQFASSVSFSGGRKYVILDEADYLNATSTQPALRNFMEEYSGNCGFILTCNFKNRIIEPLHSRCSVVDFKISKQDIAKLAGLFFKRATGILSSEGVQFEQAVVAEVVKQHVPDWRRVLNELQRYSATGKIDSGILTNLGDESFKKLVTALKTRNFHDMRKWVVEHSDSDTTVFRKIYDSMHDLLKPTSIPQTILIIARYQYQAAFVSDPEINLAAFLTNLMVESEWQ
jgi:DNA polymerase III delta prime subunit